MASTDHIFQDGWWTSWPVIVKWLWRIGYHELLRKGARKRLVPTAAEFGSAATSTLKFWKRSSNRHPTRSLGRHFSISTPAVPSLCNERSRRNGSSAIYGRRPCSEPTTPVRRKWQLILVNPAHDSGVVDEYLCFILSFTPYAPCHMNTSSSNKLLREL